MNDIEEDDIDFVYSFFGDLLDNGKIDDCDNYIRNIDIKSKSPAIIASILTAISGAKTVLIEWDRFLDKAIFHVGVETLVGFKMKTNDEFLKTLFYHIDKTDRVTDLIFDYVDRLLANGKFDVVDSLLGMIDFDKLNDTVLRSFLVITFAAKLKLKNRAKFYIDVVDNYGGSESVKLRLFDRLK